MREYDNDSEKTPVCRALEREVMDKMDPETFEQVNEAFCSHMEHSSDEEILSDHTFCLYYAYPEKDREEPTKMLKAQLYSRKMSVARFESWFVDCRARYWKDPEGFLENATAEHARRHLDKQAAEREPKKTRSKRLLPASAFAPEEAEYLVDPYLPRGMLSILGGVSGAGKTSLALDISARVSRGAQLGFETSPSPDGDTSPDRRGKITAAPDLAPLSGELSSECETERFHQNVIYLTAENDPNKVLRPRVERLGADLDHIYFQNGANFSMQDAELEELCKELYPALLVFDPIQSYLGHGVQMNRAEQVRPILDRLGALAKQLDMAVLLISHMSKPGPGVSSALDRLLGSSDFRNAARSILIVGRDPENPERRVFAHAKNSLGEAGPSQLYRIVEGGCISYEGETSLTADRIIQATEPASRSRPAATLNDAVQALEKQIGFVGWVSTSDAYRLCAQQGFSERTLRNAKEALRLNVLMTGQVPNRRTYWYRSDLTRDEVLADINGQHEQLAV